MKRARSRLKGRTAVMIAVLAVVWMASAPRPAWGQSAWPGYPNNTAISVTSSGNVGIGTSAPSAKLQTQTADDTAPTLIGAWDGRHVAVTNGVGGLGLSYSSTNNTGYISVVKPNVAWGNLVLQPWASGNVGIATTNPQYLLSVNGTIGTKDVIVTNTGWSDYVFRSGYRLQPLSEVGAYIQAHHHLPGIPSEREVKEKGFSVGEMQARLLAKIEELTLHMIQQDKDNRELREQMSRREKENKELRERLAQLENRAAGTVPAAGR